VAELKTKATTASVPDYLAGIADAGQRADCQSLVKIMRKLTKSPPKMWGASMVGFGTYRYKYPSGREGEWFLIGFSPRKQNLSIHVMAGLHTVVDLLPSLGKYKLGKSCLYVKRLDEVDLDVLKEILARSVKTLAELRD
jgi:hypothetical protein